MILLFIFNRINLYKKYIIKFINQLFFYSIVTLSVSIIEYEEYTIIEFQFSFPLTESSADYLKNVSNLDF